MQIAQPCGNYQNIVDTVYLCENLGWDVVQEPKTLHPTLRSLGMNSYLREPTAERDLGLRQLRIFASEGRQRQLYSIW